MKKTLLSIFSLLFIFQSGVLHSQILFDKKYSGGMTALYGDVVSDGFIFAGHILVNGYDAALAKIDSFGHVQWSYKYGGEGNQDGFRKVRVTKDNNYLLAGYTNSFKEDYYWNYLLAKIDTSGSVLWAKEIGGLFAEEGWDMMETSDSCYFAVGYTKSFGPNDMGGRGDILAVKLSYNGEVLWTKVFGSEQSDWIYSMTESNDGGFLLTGNTYYPDYGKHVISLIKLDKDGNLIWKKFLNGGGYGDDCGYEVKESLDGSIYVTGNLNIMGENRTCLIKTDSAGNVAWARIYGGFFGDTGFSFEFSSDGGFIIGGSSTNYMGEVKPVLMKLDADANVEWMRIFGDYEQGEIRQVKLTHDGTYIAGGFINVGGANKIYLVKTDEAGHTYCNSTIFQPAASPVNVYNIEFNFTSSEPGNFDDVQFAKDSISLLESNTCDCPSAVNMQQFSHNVQDNKVDLEWTTKSENNNNGFNVYRNNQLVGSVPGNGTSSASHSYSFTDIPHQQGKYTYHVDQLTSDGIVNVVGETNIDIQKVTLGVNDNSIPATYNLQQNYPNPFNPVTIINYSVPQKANVSLIIYDMLGNEVITLVNKEQAAGNYTINFDGSGLSSGIYFYQLKSGSFTKTMKMTLLK